MHVVEVLKWIREALPDIMQQSQQLLRPVLFRCRSVTNKQQLVDRSR